MDAEGIKQPGSKDPFLQRAIEHWLDSANELGYQPLFCEWLITSGYILKYSIKNTHFEQGKDVVAVSGDGTPHAFQLKGGNINLKRWRDEVKPEIDVLIGGAIQHPEIDKAKPHVSYLVTNGEIEDNVRVEIVALNEKAWEDTPLRCWTRGDLLNGFQQMAEGILPKDAETYKKLIELIFTDGTGFPEQPKIYGFLSEILNLEDASRAKEQRRRDIAAAVLYATMIAGPYRSAKNHASAVRIMVILLSLIFHIVDKYKLDDKYWIESYRIIWADVIATAGLLEKEVNAGELESVQTSPFDADLVPFRKHLAVSTVYPLKLSQYIADNKEWESMLDPQVVVHYRETILIWGEAALLPFVFIAMMFKNLTGGRVTAGNLIKTGIQQILEHNGRRSKDKTGLIPPYYDIDFAVKLSFGLLEDEFEDKYKFGSYLLKPLVEILTRMGERDFIAEQWRELSFMHFDEFVPDTPADYYLWRVPTGENLSVMPKKEKSWNELADEANSFDGKSLPPTLKRFPEFLPFFLMAFPHRATSETIGFLYNRSSPLSSKR